MEAEPTTRRTPVVEDALVRPALLARLDRRWDLPLGVVVAGAGFGKTTALVQAIEQNRLSPKGRDVWLSLDSSHSAASALLQDIATRLDPAFEAARETTIDDVVLLMASEAPGHIALMLDDLHRLDQGCDAEATVQQLLDQLPANAHLIISGRAEPPIDVARMEAHRLVFHVGEDDLRLQREETAELARRSGVDAAVLDDLGGWPAIIELAIRSGDSTATEFIWQEVLDEQPPDLRATLEIAALIDGHQPDVIDEIAGTVDVAQQLTTLPLVARLDDGTIRPHHLWRERLDSIGDDALVDRCADALTARGENSRVFELLADTSRWDRALAALFAACADQRQPPFLGEMRRWRDRIPADLRERPEVRFLEGMILRQLRPWSARTASMLDSAMSGFEAAGDRRSMMVTGVRATFVPYARCDGPAYRTLSERIFRATPPSVAAMAAFLSHDEQTAGRLLAELDDATIEPRLRFFMPMMRADLLVAAGRVAPARAHFEEAALLAAQCDQAGGTLEARVRHDVVRFLDGDLEIALDDRFERDITRYTESEQLEAVAWGAMARLHTGRSDEIDAALAPIHRAAIAPQDLPRVDGIMSVVLAGAALERSDDAQAADLIERCLPGGRIERSGRSSAVLWQPATAAAVSQEVEELLRSCIVGPDGLAAIDLGRALRLARTGQEPPPRLLAHPDLVLCRLPFGLAVELACHGLAAGDDDARIVIERAIDVAPQAGRRELRRVADSDGSASEAARSLLGALPIPPQQALRLQVLGSTRLFRDGTEVEEKDWRRERTRSLMMLLVHHRDISRARAAAELWPDAETSRAASNLRLTLHYLQRSLEPDRQKGDAPYLLHQDDGALRLAGTDRLDVDVWEFEEALDAAADAERQGALTVALDHLEQALGAWNGLYMADVDGADWVDLERRRLSVRYVAAAVRAGGLQLALDRADDAVETATQALGVEPWSEEAYRVLIAGYTALGDRAAALRSAEECRHMLADLEVEPAPETLMVERMAREARKE